MGEGITGEVEIREVRKEEYEALGELTVGVYSQLPNMPGPDAMPDYYAMLRDVKGRLAESSVKIFVAVDSDSKILGGVTFVGDMKDYGSEGTATQVKNA